MINLDQKTYCICPKIKIMNTPKECKDQYTISEQGKSITLRPKTQEKVLAIVIDQCIITDETTKCDALYLYKKQTKKYSFLVELKGAGDIPKAFKQLSYTRDNRNEYKDMINRFYDIDSKKVTEKFAIVSNGTLEKTQLEELENRYNIRVKKILHSEATTPIPDLKELL